MSIQVPPQYQADVQSAARAAGLPVAVVAAQISAESGFNANAVSPTGAQGIAQFEPGTWAQWGHGSPFNPAAAFPAYAAFMRSLLRQFGGSIRDALAAYNAGPGNLAAGYGYADSILAAAGQPGSATSSAGGGQGTAQQAQLTSFLSAPSGVLGDAGALLHGTAVVLDRAFGLFAPGQGWRIVFGAVALAMFIMSYKAFGGAVA